MTGIFHVTEGDWKSEVLDVELPVVVNFWGPACVWCKRLDPLYEEMAEEFQGRLKFTKVNVAENSKLAMGLGIMGTPTLKFFCQGRSVHEIVGFRPREQLKEEIERALGASQECIERSTLIE